MDAREATLLCRLTKAACPAQAIDEYTPDVWLDLLGDLRFEDAKAGMLAAAQTAPFVAPAEIRREVRRVRRKRIDEAGDLTPPPGLDPEQTNDWLGRARRRIGDGVPVTEVVGDHYGELKTRHLPDLRQLMPAPDNEKGPS